MRNEAISEHNAAREDELWCPVLQSFEHETNVERGHIFPRDCGQGDMTSIFDTRDELNSPKNSILHHKDIEILFGKHAIAYIPDVKTGDDGRYDRAALYEWVAHPVTEYCVKVFKPDLEAMQKTIVSGPYKGRTYSELDGMSPQFRSTYRPRARYLYVHYLNCWVRELHAMENDLPKYEHLMAEADKPMWGSIGKNLRHPQLQGLVESCGHRYDQKQIEFARG